MTGRGAAVGAFGMMLVLIAPLAAASLVPGEQQIDASLIASTESLSQQLNDLANLAAGLVRGFSGFATDVTDTLPASAQQVGQIVQIQADSTKEFTDRTVDLAVDRSLAAVPLIEDPTVQALDSAADAARDVGGLLQRTFQRAEDFDNAAVAGTPDVGAGLLVTSLPENSFQVLVDITDPAVTVVSDFPQPGDVPTVVVSGVNEDVAAVSGFAGDLPTRGSSLAEGAIAFTVDTANDALATGVGIVPAA